MRYLGTSITKTIKTSITNKVNKGGWECMRVEQNVWELQVKRQRQFEQSSTASSFDLTLSRHYFQVLKHDSTHTKVHYIGNSQRIALFMLNGSSEKTDIHLFSYMFSNWLHPPIILNCLTCVFPTLHFSRAWHRLYDFPPLVSFCPALLPASCFCFKSSDWCAGPIRWSH